MFVNTSWLADFDQWEEILSNRLLWFRNIKITTTANDMIYIAASRVALTL